MTHCTFSRAENWAEAHGIRFQARPGREMFAPLCRLLVMAGFEDGRLRCFDERGVHCVTIPSILRLAGRTCFETDSGSRGWRKWRPNEWVRPGQDAPKPCAVDAQDGGGGVSGRVVAGGGEKRRGGLVGLP